MTSLYETHVAIKPTGSVRGYASLGSPPGVVLPAALEDLLQGLVGTLSLAPAGILTPWAARTGDVAWTDIVKPDTNISTFAMSEVMLKQAEQALFNTPLPFVLVLTDKIQPTTQLQEILDEAPYELYQTQAVYRQSDAKSIPSIAYVHWLKVKDLDEQPSTPKSMDTVAQEMGGGRLLYGQQVPVESSSIRPAPTMPFSQALVYEASPPVNSTPSTSVPNESVPEYTAATTDPAAKLPWLGVAAVGVGALFATIALGRALKK